MKQFGAEPEEQRGEEIYAAQLEHDAEVWDKMQYELRIYKEQLIEEIDKLKKITNKNCLVYEPDICNLCHERELRRGFNDALEAVIAIIRKERG